MMSEADTRPGTCEYGDTKYDLGSTGDNIVKITDRGGHSLHFQWLRQGVYCGCISNARLLENIKNFKMRDDDIYFPGYLRTGCHWTFERASMLLNGKAETIERFKDHMELLSQEEFDKLPSPRIINCHMRLSDAPDDVRLKKLKVLFTLRDPKDVAVSLYEMYYGRPLYGGAYMGSFGDFLQLFLEGKVDLNGIFEHWINAEKFFEQNPDVPVHFQIYEKAQKDPVGAVHKLSDFLGFPRNDVLCREIADKCQFKKMKVDKDKYAFKIDGNNFLYRKGTVGDWRNYFTDEMLEDYYRVYEEKMTGSRFYSLYTRDKD